jgi:hypothetical protein
MKKNIFIVGFIAILVGTAFVQYKASLPKKTIASQVFISSLHTVTIDGVKKTKQEQIKVGKTALQLLSTTHKTITKGEKQNAFVTEIDGRTALAEKREFWAFYVNGKQAAVGAGSYIVKNNDTIEWKIETY